VTVVRGRLKTLVCATLLAFGAAAPAVADEKFLGRIKFGDDTVPVLIANDPNERNGSFNKSLDQNRQSGKILSCSLLVDVWVGNPDSNRSYGGYCVLRRSGRSQKVEICNDDMVGHFELRASSEPPTISQLIRFTANNCFGG
jgi:hypothetical protein